MLVTKLKENAMNGTIVAATNWNMARRGQTKLFTLKQRQIRKGKTVLGKVKE